MCARYERAVEAWELEKLIRATLADGAEDVPAKGEVMPTDMALMVGDFGEGLQIKPASWGIWCETREGPMQAINAREDKLRSVTEWRTAIPCWMPATGWFEWQEFEGRKKSWKKPKYRLGPDIEGPFMLRALAQHQRGSWRCAFITQDAPPHILPMHDRAPFPYPVSVVHDPSAPSLLNRCTGVRLSPGRASPELLKDTDERVAAALRAMGR